MNISQTHVREEFLNPIILPWLPVEFKLEWTKEGTGHKTGICWLLWLLQRNQRNQDVRPPEMGSSCANCDKHTLYCKGICYEFLMQRKVPKVKLQKHFLVLGVFSGVFRKAWKTNSSEVVVYIFCWKYSIWNFWWNCKAI